MHIRIFDQRKPADGIFKAAYWSNYYVKLVSQHQKKKKKGKLKSNSTRC